MFEVTNLSNNLLTLSDGKPLAAKSSRNLKTIKERDKEFENRGWLMIAEPKKPSTKSDTGGKK